jgi:hypothetical protein
MALRVPQAAIIFNPDTKHFGFSVWMPGKWPHYEMLDLFRTALDAKQWLDPHGERIWDESADGGTVAEVSREYRPGSVPMRL